jgi:hypothetical protein
MVPEGENTNACSTPTVLRRRIPNNRLASAMFDDKDQKICPSCGNKVEAGADTCGFCGNPLSGNDPSGGGRPRPEFQRLSPPDEQEVSATSAVGTMGGMPPGGGTQPTPTYVSAERVVAAGTGWVKWIVFFVALVIIAATAVPIILAMREVDDAFDSTRSIDFGGGGGGGGIAGGKEPAELAGAYKNSRALVSDLKKNGVKCTNLDVATRNAFVEAALCYVNGDPVNTQIYFDSTALNGVLGSMANLKDSNVVHDANWIIMAPTSRKVARDVKAAIGGKLE